MVVVSGTQPQGKMMKIEHCEASRVWYKCRQPGHPMQVFARFAVMMCLRRRHPITVERHLHLIEITIARLEEAAKHEQEGSK